MNKLSLFCVILLAACLRFVNLTQIPPALNSDEIAIGYNAYSILQTGMDEYGNRLPYTFRSFDDYKMPVYVYLVAGSMKLFGYGDFAVRFPSALLGTATIFFTYLLAFELLKKKNVALVSAFFLAISPWHIGFSRSGYEANVAVFFIVAGIYFFLKKNLIVSSILLSVSIWTYLTPRLFVPILMVGFAVIYRNEIRTRKFQAFCASIIALVLLFPIIRMSFSIEGQMRASGVSAFSNPDDLARSAIRLASDHSVFRIFSNRRIVQAMTFLRGYFSHFDPNFFFLDKSIEKYRAPDTGLLYLSDLPLILIGTYMLIRQRNQASWAIIWWILISPIAAAFTLQLPHPVRTLVFLPALQFISAIGFISAWNRLKHLRFIVIGCIIISFIYFLRQYFIFLPIELGPQWYVGRKEMTEKIMASVDDYDEIYVSNALDFPYIFYLYYSKTNPFEYLSFGGTVSGGFLEQNNQFKNIYFRSISASIQNPGKKQLFIGLPGEAFKKTSIVDTIYYPDGSEAIVFFR